MFWKGFASGVLLSLILYCDNWSYIGDKISWAWRVEGVKNNKFYSSYTSTFLFKDPESISTYYYKTPHGRYWSCIGSSSVWEETPEKVIERLTELSKRHYRYEKLLWKEFGIYLYPKPVPEEA